MQKNNEELKVFEIALVANLQTAGPVFIADAIGSIDTSSGMLLAARLIITAGIGSTSSPYNKLYGSLPIPEINPDYECYFFVGEIQQKPLETSPFFTGKGTYVYAIIVPALKTQAFLPYIEKMEDILIGKINRIDFADTLSGEIPPELSKQASDLLKEIYNEINAMIKFTNKYHGGSLFDLSFIMSLEPKMQLIAKKLIMSPNGILFNEIEDKDILNNLYLAGLVDKKTIDGQVWVIPR